MHGTILWNIITARCTLVQSAVLRSHVVCLSVCPSVRPSVTLVDQDNIGPRLDISETNRTDNPNTFALRSPKAIHLLPGEHREIMGRLEVGWEKVVCWSTRAAISLKRVKIKEKLLWRAYRNLLMLFRMVPFLTPFPKIGGSQPHPKLQSLLSEARVKIRTSNLAGTFTGSIQTKSH